MISLAWDTSDKWLDGSSRVVAFMRLARKRSRSGLMVWSLLDTAYHDGYLTLSQDAFLKYFAADVPHAKAMELYAVQQPITKTLFSGRTVNAAWHTKPSWYAVSANDQTINPDLERCLAKRMNATTIELPSSHLSLVSHAKEITDLILEASGRQP